VYEGRHDVSRCAILGHRGGSLGTCKRRCRLISSQKWSRRPPRLGRSTLAWSCRGPQTLHVLHFFPTPHPSRVHPIAVILSIAAVQLPSMCDRWDGDRVANFTGEYLSNAPGYAFTHLCIFSKRSGSRRVPHGHCRQLSSDSSEKPQQASLQRRCQRSCQTQSSRCSRG
jgi:hypothetical protein